MIEYRKGDIFKQPDIGIIIHQANCFCKMKSGIAKTISKLYPGAVEADKRTRIGDESKLGTYTEYTDDKGKVIINMYSQYYYGTDTRKTSYLAMKTALKSIRDDYCNGICEHTIGIPDHIGCGLAGGSWQTVKTIIEEVFEDIQDKIVICKI